MSHQVRVFQVDAFTSQRFSGNPAGVVLDADGLSAQDMLLLARELNNADTAFVLQPDADDHDIQLRFFTPRREVAFVGHATLAVHAVLAALGLPARPRQKQRSGIVEVDTIGTASPPRIAIHQPPPTLQRTLTDGELSAVLEALTLTRSQLDPATPAMIAGDSSTRVLLGIAHGATLNALQPDLSRLAALSEQIGTPGFFLFTRQPTVADVYTEARMFCPALGFAEDPVSGNAHALLGTYLLHCGLLATPASSASSQLANPPPNASQDWNAASAQSDTIEFTGVQGHHMNRPGRVTVALNLERKLLRSVTIVGEAVIVFSTTVDF